METIRPRRSTIILSAGALVFTKIFAGARRKAPQVDQVMIDATASKKGCFPT